jgi:hypothetical protein
MKRILLTLCVIAFVNSLCFAQQSSVPVSQAAPEPVETKTFTGKIEFVSGARSKGTDFMPRIVCIDEKGNIWDCYANITTVIFNKDGKLITIVDIKKGDKVVIIYVPTKMLAKSIKVVE